MFLAKNAAGVWFTKGTQYSSTISDTSKAKITIIGDNAFSIKWPYNATLNYWAF